jgi:hypothetical protein
VVVNENGGDPPNDNNNGWRDVLWKEIPARLWASSLRRTKEMAQFIEHNVLQATWDNGDTGEWVQLTLLWISNGR